MKNKRQNIQFQVAALSLILFFSTVLFAQQAIFNVPSTDILAKGKIYVEFDATFKTNNQDYLSKFSSFVPRVVVGTGGDVEVGLNIAGNIQPGSDSTTLIPAVKWRVYNGSDNGWAVVVGDNLYIPVRNKSYKVGNYLYAQASKTFRSGTRLTAGGYHFSKNTVAANANRAGGQFGFEQVVNKYLNINADWYTGKHVAGYFTPGIALKLHPKVAAYAGYSIGNVGVGSGNHFFYTAVGVNLN
jgi:hypothetical protein